LAATIRRIYRWAAGVGKPSGLHIHISLTNCETEFLRGSSTCFRELTTNGFIPPLLRRHARWSVARVNSDPITYIGYSFITVVKVDVQGAISCVVFRVGFANAECTVILASICIISIGTIIALLARIKNAISTKRSRAKGR
jgi:hypothetical protein